MKLLFFFVILNAILLGSSIETELLSDDAIEKFQKNAEFSIPVAPALDQPTMQFTELGFRLLGIYSKIISNYHRNHFNNFSFLSSSQSN